MQEHAAQLREVVAHIQVVIAIRCLYDRPVVALATVLAVTATSWWRPDVLMC